MVSVAVVFFAFFLCAFLVALVAVSFWANKTALPDRSERLRAAIMIFFIFGNSPWTLVVALSAYVCIFPKLCEELLNPTLNWT